MEQMTTFRRVPMIWTDKLPETGDPIYEPLTISLPLIKTHDDPLTFTIDWSGMVQADVVVEGP